MGITTVELLPFHQFGEKKYEYLEREYTMHDIPQLHTEDLDYFKAIFEDHQISCSVH
jgi:pyruvate formate lyase activating enzyme